MSRETLQFVHADRPPATDGIRVFDSLTREFLGATVTFRVIGSSHYVSAPAHAFYELSACEPPPTADDGATADGRATTDDGATADGRVATDDGAATDDEATAGREGTAIPLEPDHPPRRLEFETDTLRCETVVDHRPLAAFPHERFRSRPDSFDLAYAFDGPEAVTTIEIDDDASAYETYHTYPEFDLALYTRTEFTVVGEPGGSALEAEISTQSTPSDESAAQSTPSDESPPEPDGVPVSTTDGTRRESSNTF